MNGDDCTQPHPPTRRESVTSQGWVSTPDNSETRNYGNNCIQPYSPARNEPESTTFPGWFETLDHGKAKNFRDDCARLRSRARRGSVASQFGLGYCEPAISTERTSLDPRSSSVAAQSDQREDFSGNSLETTGLLRRFDTAPDERMRDLTAVSCMSGRQDCFSFMWVTVFLV